MSVAEEVMLMEQISSIAIAIRKGVVILIE